MGIVEGVIASLIVPTAFLTAPQWKGVIGIPPGRGMKDAARSEAIRRWPAQATLFARVKEDGRAEAALVAAAGIQEGAAPVHQGTALQIPSRRELGLPPTGPAERRTKRPVAAAASPENKSVIIPPLVDAATLADKAPPAHPPFEERDVAPPIGETGQLNRRGAAVEIKSVADFCAAYEPVSNTVESLLRSSSLYALTGKTGGGKTALLSEDRPTLGHGVDRAHATHLQQRFIEAGLREAGLRAEYIDCYTDREERERIFDRFRAGDVRVIANVATLTVGVNLPMVGCIVDARPTKSEMRFVQTIGRGLRTHLGKRDLRVPDHAGNHLRLGLVTDIHHDRLDDGESRRGGNREREERAVPFPRMCDDCKAVVPRGAIRCECGLERPAATQVHTVDGRLVALGFGESSRIEATLEDKAAFFAELLWIARVKGYSSGWAAHQFKERFGVWPNHPRIKHTVPRRPSLSTSNWVRSRAITFAKGRAARG